MCKSCGAVLLELLDELELLDGDECDEELLEELDSLDNDDWLESDDLEEELLELEDDSLDRDDIDDFDDELLDDELNRIVEPALKVWLAARLPPESVGVATAANVDGVGIVFSP